MSANITPLDKAKAIFGKHLYKHSIAGWCLHGKPTPMHKIIIMANQAEEARKYLEDNHYLADSSKSA